MVRIMFFIAFMLILIIVTLIIIDFIKRNKEKQKMRARAEIFKNDDISRFFLEELYSLAFPYGRKKSDGLVSIFSFIDKTGMDIDDYKKVSTILKDNGIIMQEKGRDRIGFTQFGLELFKNFISEQT